MLLLYARQMLMQPRVKTGWQHRPTVLLSLAPTHEDPATNSLGVPCATCSGPGGARVSGSAGRQPGRRGPHRKAGEASNPRVFPPARSGCPEKAQALCAVTDRHRSQLLAAAHDRGRGASDQKLCAAQRPASSLQSCAHLGPEAEASLVRQSPSPSVARGGCGDIIGDTQITACDPVWEIAHITAPWSQMRSRERSPLMKKTHVSGGREIAGERGAGPARCCHA